MELSVGVGDIGRSCLAAPGPSSAGLGPDRRHGVGRWVRSVPPVSHPTTRTRTLTGEKPFKCGACDAACAVSSHRRRTSAHTLSAWGTSGIHPWRLPCSRVSPSPPLSAAQRLSPGLLGAVVLGVRRALACRRRRLSCRPPPSMFAEIAVSPRHPFECGARLASAAVVVRRARCLAAIATASERGERRASAAVVARRACRPAAATAS